MLTVLCDAVPQTATVNNSNPEQLIISNITMEHAGWYTCVVSNAIGVEYGSAWLTVVEDRGSQTPLTPPPPPHPVSSVGEGGRGLCQGGGGGGQR